MTACFNKLLRENVRNILNF